MGVSVFQKLSIIKRKKRGKKRKRNNGKGWEGREVNGWKRKVGEIGKKTMISKEVKKKRKNERQITVEDIKKF